MKTFRFPVLIIAILQISPHVHGAISVIDDLGNRISFDSPVRRIVSLAPHTTELLFASGAGELVVGAVRYSNYPEPAQLIPRVGDTHNLDIEAIISLEPDIVIAWQSGNRQAIIDRLGSLDYMVYVSEPGTIEDIAKTIRDLGDLSGRRETALEASDRFINELYNLKLKYAGRKRVKTFYQIWDQPMFTVNGRHLISEVIRLCGGDNIFNDLATLSTQINREAVLNSDPDVIIASGADDTRPPWLQEWYRWPSLRAVKYNQIYFIPPDLIQRHTPRILQGARMMCEYIDAARIKINGVGVD